MLAEKKKRPLKDVERQAVASGFIGSSCSCTDTRLVVGSVPVEHVLLESASKGLHVSYMIHSASAFWYVHLFNNDLLLKAY